MEQKTNFVFDLFGVIFHINMWQAANYVGFARTLKYLLMYRQNPLYTTFWILDLMRKEELGEFQDIVAYQGIYLPNTLCLWLKGQLSSEEANERIMQFLKKIDKDGQKGYNHPLIHKLFAIMTLPPDAQHIITCSVKMASIITLLNAKGHKCYVLSNIDSQTYQFIKTRYKEVFGQLDGAIVSCKEGLLKPEREIFLKIESEFHLPLSSCFYVDDQLENIAAAKSLGAQGFLFDNERALMAMLKAKKYL